AGPEFDELGCLACHHNLLPDGWRQKVGYGKRKPGAITWSNQVFLIRRVLESRDEPSLASLVKHLDSLQAMFDADRPDRHRLKVDAKKAAMQLNELLGRWKDEPARATWVDDLHRSVLKDAPNTIGGWDEVTRIQLALVALQIARRNMKLPVTATKFVNPLAKLDVRNYSGGGRFFEPLAIQIRVMGQKATNQWD